MAGIDGETGSTLDQVIARHPANRSERRIAPKGLMSVAGERRPTNS
jgi:hypothetical protein